MRPEQCFSGSSDPIHPTSAGESDGSRQETSLGAKKAKCNYCPVGILGENSTVFCIFV